MFWAKRSRGPRHASADADAVFHRIFSARSSPPMKSLTNFCSWREKVDARLLVQSIWKARSLSTSRNFFPRTSLFSRLPEKARSICLSFRVRAQPKSKRSSNICVSVWLGANPMKLRCQSNQFERYLPAMAGLDMAEEGLRDPYAEMRNKSGRVPERVMFVPPEPPTALQLQARWLARAIGTNSVDTPG